MNKPPILNYVAFAIYKNKLREMTFIESQRFCDRILTFNNVRLTHALYNAIIAVRPVLLDCFDNYMDIP